MSERRYPTSLPSPLPLLKGAHVSLRAFDASQIGDRYLTWLNDPEVNRFSQRGGRATTEADARRYLESRSPDEAIFGIHLGSLGHVGNIKLGPVDWVNRRADISIVIGEKSTWGRGVAAEAVYLASCFAFEDLRLNRVDAASGNPAFLRAVAKLGWGVEGVLRQRVRLETGFVDWTIVAQLRREFRRRPELERTKD